MSLIWHIILVALPIGLWGVSYRFLHIRERVNVVKLSYIDDAISLNGCGSSFIGGFKIKNSSARVYYVMATILFIPIFPVKAIVAKGKETGLFSISTKYEIDGETDMSLMEIPSCYALRWGIAVSLISFFFVWDSL